MSRPTDWYSTTEPLSSKNAVSVHCCHRTLPSGMITRCSTVDTGWSGGEGGEALLDPGLVIGRDGEGVPPPDEVAARDADVAAVGVVREGDGAVGGEPAADQLGLALHDRPGPLLALPEASSNCFSLDMSRKTHWNSVTRPPGP